MKALCVDDSNGYNDETAKPKFKYGDVLDVEIGKYLNTYFVPMDGRNWSKKRFIPISEIDETEFERDYKMIKEGVGRA